jgi:hypothetical protein
MSPASAKAESAANSVGRKIQFVSYVGCPPCQDVKKVLLDYAAHDPDAIEIEILEVEPDEFVALWLAGRVGSRIVPALLLYDGPAIVARAVGLRGKHGELDGPFVARWLQRHGLTS